MSEPSIAAGAPILVVEDHADTLAFCETLFKSRGYHVAGAASAQEALGLLDTLREAPIVVTDLDLPDMPWQRFFSSLRAHPERPPRGIIVVTGWSNGHRRDGLEREALEYVFLKPVEPYALLAAVAALHNTQTTS